MNPKHGRSRVDLITYRGNPQSVIVLDAVSDEMPSYTTFGKITCLFCRTWCWLGPNTYKPVTTKVGAPICHACAKVHIAPGSKPMRNFDADPS